MVDQLIMAAEAVVRYRVATYRDRFKLTELQYRMMMHVARQAPITIGHLAVMVDRDIAQVSRTVRLLIDSGLMVCSKVRGSQAKALKLSPEGQAVHRQMAMIGEEWEGAISDAMPSDAIARATQAMEQLYVAANRILDRDDSDATRDRGGDRAADRPVCFTRRDRRRVATLAPIS